jgi:O-antigen ligase
LIIAWNIICSFRAITLGWVDTNFCILTNLKLIEFFVIFFLIVNNLNDIKEVKFMLYILLFVALVIGIYTALQIPKTQMFSSRRLTAPFEGTPEPNTLGAYLAIFFGAALSIFIYAEKSPMRNICAVLVILLPFPIMFSFARSAYIAAIVMILAIAIISKRKWVFWTLIVFLLLSPFIVPNPVISRAFYNFQDRRYFGYFDPSAAERITVYKKLWDNLKFQPIFGQGVAWGGGILDSQYARVGIETGVPGLLLFFWLIIRLLKMGISLFKSSEGWIKGMALGFIVVVIGVIVHGIGNITLFIVRIAEPFWGLVALVAFTYYISLQKPALSNDFKGNVK